MLQAGAIAAAHPMFGAVLAEDDRSNCHEVLETARITPTKLALPPLLQVDGTVEQKTAMLFSFSVVSVSALLVRLHVT